ncbi:MAG: bifunctional 5,10-methylenetetrahydrofolate dehydrogenase/5,10-methenyltetrahydrofolate cyclohydrolase [Sedimentisphaerales bacterium]|nr:bifunctional 5,10-methylenetetrahydrofolate dehydrogenase/5,10-methenyltetrahydrofolate cyclohydrolase [Sedimentisphaerales bacterium]
MTATLLQGDKLASEIKEGLKKDIEQLKAKGFPPHLVAVQVGESPASRVYIRQQQKSCEEIGIEYEVKELPGSTTNDELLDFIETLNQDSAVTGIILMMPLPQDIDARQVQIKISPDKDVEGMHPANMGRLVYGEMELAPCTARAAVELLKASGVELKGKEVVIVGHSEIVGKPLTLMLLASQIESPTPTVCHIATKDLSFHTKRADIVFVAVGKPGLIQADMVKEGVIVIDIGINRVPVTDEDGKPVLNEKGKPKKKIVGDVDFEGIKEKASFITPVPGGVGPMTTTMLLCNTVESAKRLKVPNAK